MQDLTDPVTVDELHAFVDRQLDAGRLRAVAAWLHTHPDDAARVQAWHAQRQQLRQRARAMDLGAPPAALAEAVLHAGRSGRRPVGWQQAAAALLLLALGAGAEHWVSADRAARGALTSSPAFVREAAVAHAVFVPEKRHPVEVTAAEEAHLVQWLGRRLGAPVKAPVLLERGYRLLGGRLLPGDPAPRAQFMYEDAQGRRVTLFVAVFAPGQATGQTPGETSFRSVREGERESFYWVDGSFGYALSAQLPPAELQGLAREVHAQLAR
jgi:anti-sigma factor RsiW